MFVWFVVESLQILFKVSRAGGWFHLLKMSFMVEREDSYALHLLVLKAADRSQLQGSKYTSSEKDVKRLHSVFREGILCLAET